MLYSQAAEIGHECRGRNEATPLTRADDGGVQFFAPIGTDNTQPKREPGCGSHQRRSAPRLRSLPAARFSVSALRHVGTVAPILYQSLPSSLPGQAIPARRL